jgi:hypothetical protein
MMNNLRGIAKRQMRVSGCMLLAALALAQPARAQDYPNLEEYAREKVDTGAPWYRACMKVKDLPPPKEDAPAAALMASLGECDALDLYYGTADDPAATQADWDKVRACALANNDHAVLTMLYANGLGVKFNPDLALQHACSGNGMTIDPRVVAQAIMDVQRSGRPPRPPYDICDAAVSGRAQIRCGQLSEAQSDAEDARELDELSRDWSAPQKAALARLHQAAMEYADAWGEESDEDTLAEDGAVPSPIGSERVRQKAQFIGDIEDAEDGRLPKYTPARAAALEKRLEQSLRESLNPEPAADAGADAETGPSPDDVRNTQRAWLAYRDAWVAYGRARYPRVPAYAWKAWLAERRIGQLEDDDGGE